MATGWVRSLQCKSTAPDDVYHPTTKQSKKKPFLPLDCGKPAHALRDVVVLLPEKPNSTPQTQDFPPPPKSRNTKHKSKRKPRPKPEEASLLASPAERSMAFPTLAELPAGHSSRCVVEIIFGSSWSRRGAPAPFPGEIELLFRFHHPPRAVARFEEYRAAVRARAVDDDARCAADGNEMMRFHSAPAAAPYDAAGAACAVGAWGGSGKLGGIRTFAGSGGAHESAGEGAGRRAMLVCRVIAGRVRAESHADPDGRFDSVATGKGELLVLDTRAVLPCFLILYTL